MRNLFLSSRCLHFFSGVVLFILFFSVSLQALIPYGPKPSWQACERHYEALYQLREITLHKKVWDGYSCILMLPSAPLSEQYQAGLDPFRKRYEELMNSPGVIAGKKMEHFHQFQEKIHVGRRLADFGMEQGLYNNRFTGNGRTLASDAYRRYSMRNPWKGTQRCFKISMTCKTMLLMSFRTFIHAAALRTGIRNTCTIMAL